MANKKGINRLLGAFFYSIKGLGAAVKNEVAFRQEIVISLLLLPILFFLDISGLVKLLILTSHLVVLIVELINSAIEAVVDLVSPEYHELAKRAKDMGSAAVLISLISAGTFWVFGIYLAIDA